MWKVIKIQDAVHVIPEIDLKPHDQNPECGCHPEYEDGVYIHNSYDERELTENFPRC